MDGWLKVLVASACVVVIAGGGWYAWGEYSRYSIQSERAEIRERVRKELFSLAQANDNEPEKVRTLCGVLRDRPDDFSNKEFAAQVLRNCRALGYL